MRVLQAINALAAGGAEVFVTDLSVALAAHSEVHLVVYAGVLDEKGRALAGSLSQAGVVLHDLSIPRRAEKWRVPLQIARIIGTFRPDVVHVHLEQSEMLCALAATLTKHKPRYVRTLHNIVIHRMEARWMQPWLRRFYDWHIACSFAVLKSPAHRLPPGRSSVVENAINLSQCAEGERDRIGARARVGLPADSVVFLNIGSMRPRGTHLMAKAQDVLIRGFASSCLAPRAILVFVGDGSMRRDLEKLCDTLGVRDSISFRGIVKDTRDLYAAADFVVMPSRFEGLSITAIEAACAGIPLILSDIEPFDPFSGGGVKKCMVESVDSLSQAMRDAVAEIENLRQEAEWAAIRWRERFDIARACEEYRSIYSFLKKSGRLAPSGVPVSGTCKGDDGVGFPLLGGPEMLRDS